MATYEKKVREILSQNGCTLSDTEKAIMISGLVL
jgi:hypothetical protein